MPSTTSYTLQHPHGPHAGSARNASHAHTAHDVAGVVTVARPSVERRVTAEFLSFTADSGCLMAEQCRWPCPAEPLDPVLVARVRLLAPMVIRVGGTDGDNMEWDASDAVRHPELPVVAKALGPVGNITIEKLSAVRCSLRPEPHRCWPATVFLQPCLCELMDHLIRP